MLPYNQIVKAVCPQHDPRYNPLFQAGFTFEQPMPLQLTGCTVNNVVVPKTASQLDIFTNLWEIDGSLQGHFEYNTDLFKKETVLRFVDYYSRLLQSATDNPLENIDILAMLSHIEEHTVTKQWNDSHRQYDSTKCLHELFEHQAAKTPTRKAVVFRDQSLSYEALNQKANKLAWKLHSMGAGPDKIVALHMDRSLEMVIGLYAILKSGAAYLPIEPGLPLLRKQFMVKDAQPVTIISDKRYAENLPDMPCPTLVIDVNLELGDTCSADKVVTGVSPRNLAYCIYTSGSTGNPKGVLIEHQGICNRLQWMQEYFDLKADDRILQKTPFGFDVSVWEFFWPLISGATLVVAEPGGHHDNAYMTRTIQNEKISVVHFVPSMLEIFLTDPQSTECSTLRYVICSGEALPFGLQERFFAALPHCRLFNLYGPTEASVDVTYWKCRTGYAKNVVPIGFPVANTQLYVLNEKLQPAPIGVTGNLYIGGIQLARGYLNRDDLTKGRFISDPFGDGAGTRLYDTGDLARWLPDGAIEYLGRKDFQIKFHGVRIEAAEIEMAILQHPAIARALVCAQGLGEGMQLIAYITYKQSPGCTTEEIRSFLRQRISQSIIPSIFVVLEVFPMTPNGKIYRKALPVPQPTKPLPKAMPIGLNSIEQRIMTIWKHYLPLESIDVHRNFFEIGGTSFLLIQINQRLREQFDIEISMVEMFQYPSIALLSDFIKDNKIAESGTDALDGRKQKQQRALEKIRKLKGKG
jgi:amino acid adenylation domain-containing protein